jgi:hypothetical protein
MRRHRARWWVGAVSVALLTGCTLPPDGNEIARRDAAQDRAHDRLVSRLKALPGGTVSVRIRSGLDQGLNNVGVVVRAPASATDTEIGSLADSAERTIWLSRLDPVGSISVTVFRRGSTDPAVQRLYMDTFDERALRRKYGPRPDAPPG